MEITKYFWDLNDKAVKDAVRILKQPAHPKFIPYMINLLSRCDNPKEVFSLISKEEFIKIWPKIRYNWAKINRSSEFRDWWETIYEQLVEKYSHKEKKPKGKPADLPLKIGWIIRQARLRRGLSQKDLALMVMVRQPDISRIEEGRKNITLETLSRFCKTLEIKTLSLQENRLRR